MKVMAGRPKDLEDSFRCRECKAADSIGREREKPRGIVEQALARNDLLRLLARCVRCRPAGCSRSAIAERILARRARPNVLAAPPRARGNPVPRRQTAPANRQRRSAPQPCRRSRDTGSILARRRAFHSPADTPETCSTGEAMEVPMKHTVKEVMNKNPILVPANTPIRQVAEKMKERQVGTVMVTENDGSLCGIVTDRDVAIRAVAGGLDPQKTTVSKICSAKPKTLSPTDDTEHALELMRSHAIRRIPVVDNGKPIGIVSLGDLAVDRDPGSALGRISAAPPNG
jgi:CBS domain-containing protein